MSDQSNELVVSYSQIQAWQRCHKAWYWNYEVEIVPKQTQVYLRLGSYVHTLLQVGYEHLLFKFPRDTIVEAVRDYCMKSLADSSNTDDLAVLTKAIRLVSRYFEDIQPIFDEGAVIKAVEHHFYLQLYTPKGMPFFLQGYVDLVLELDGNLYIIDHKTTASRIWSPLQLQMDGQLATYAAVLPNVFGVGVNFLNTYDYKDFHAQPISKLYKRLLSYRTDREKEAILTNFGVIVDDMYERREARNYPYSLTPNCARCPYSELCLMELKGFDDTNIQFLINESFAPKPTRIEASVNETGEDDNP